jgi:hypothetical protein
MAIELPNLDNRTHADLVAEARASIHSLCKDWTDHNPSDPGITLIELFAWLTEMILYRTNRVTDQGYEVFLRILRSDPAWRLPSDVELADAIQETLVSLRERYRAVTAEDYELLVMQRWSPAVARVRCLAQRDVGVVPPERPGHVSVILVPPLGDFDAPWDAQFSANHQPDLVLREAVKAFLNTRRVLTTRVHVVGPAYLEVSPTATLFLEAGVTGEQVLERAIADLRRYFHPLTGGADGRGWPFGRAVYVSEVYALLDRTAGVDFVQDLDLEVSDPARRILNADGELVGVSLFEHELPKIEIDASNSFTVRERAGDVWL